MKLAIIGSEGCGWRTWGHTFPLGDGTSLRRSERYRHLRQGVRAVPWPEADGVPAGLPPVWTAAPLVRNREIVAYADQVLAFWDGKSPGTKYVIDQCKKQKKTVTVHLL